MVAPQCSHPWLIEDSIGKGFRMNGAAQPKENTSAVVSTVRSATDTQTHDYDPQGVINVIRTGGKKKTLRTQIEAIRKTLRNELARHADPNQAKKAITESKKK